MITFFRTNITKYFAFAFILTITYSEISFKVD